MNKFQLPCPVLSEGRLYDLDIPNNHIYIEPMRGDIEEVFAALTDQQGTALGDIATRNATSQLIKMPKDLPFHRLLVSDWVTCMFYIMSASYGSTLTFDDMCPNPRHNKKVRITLDFGTLPKVTASDIAKKYEIEYKEPFEMTTPLGKEKISFRLLRVGDLDAVQEYTEKAQETAVDTGRNPTPTFSMSLHIIAVNGENLGEIELRRWIKEALRGDLLAIRRAIERVETGFDLKPQLACPKCGFKFKKEIPINFFRAFGAQAE